jgi:hypothetical protein
VREPIIIADRRERGGVRGQSKRRQWSAILGEASHELSGDVLGISGAAAVAEEQDLTTIPESRSNGVTSTTDVSTLFKRQAPFQATALIQALSYP